MRKVPKLRFKEFNDEWEEKKLGDFITINGRIGFRGYTVNDIVDSKEKGAIALSPTNLLENKIYFSKLTYISNFKYEESPEIKLQIGDILLVKTGSSYGKVGFLTNLPWKATINPQLVIIKTKLNKSFLYYFMNTFIFQKQIEENIVGGAIPTLSQESIKKFKFFYTIFQEQEKIANFLSSVDKKISLTEEKLNLFKEYKKGIMQKIFSQELRFKDSNGNNYPNWEEKRMENIISFLSDYTANGSFATLKENVTYYNELNYAVLVRTTDLEKKIFIPERFTDKKGYDFLKKTALFGGEIILANVGSIGNVYKVPFYNKPMTLAPNTYVLYFNLTVDKEFMYQIMKTNDFKNKILSKVGSSTLKAINKANLKSISINLPCLEEQKKIADFLSSIDNKIEKIENEVENLKEFKKGLLQQMFI